MIGGELQQDGTVERGRGAYQNCSR